MSGIFGVFDFFDVRFNFASRNHYFATAFFTADAKIHADTQHGKAIVTARVIFFANQNISYIYIQSESLPYNTLNYIISYIFGNV